MPSPGLATKDKSGRRRHRRMDEKQLLHDIAVRERHLALLEKSRSHIEKPLEHVAFQNHMYEISRMPLSKRAAHADIFINARVMSREEFNDFMVERNPDNEIAKWAGPHEPESDYSAQPRELVSCGIKFAPKSLFQLMNEKPVERVWLVEKYLAKGWLSVLAGHPKHGKSTLVYWLVKCVLAGSDFLGFKTKRGRVLILAVEENLEDVTDRFRLSKVAEDSGLFIHCAPLKSIDVELEAIREFIKANQIDLVIVDTLARFWTVKDESNASEVSAATQPLLEMARDTGAVVLLIHHSRKSEGEDGTEIRGSGDILAVVDIGLILKKRKGSDSQRTLHAYSRYPTPKELVISLENGEYSVLGSANHVKHEEQRKKVIACLSINFKEAKDIAILADIAEGTCRTVLADLFGEGAIDRQGSGSRGKAYSYALKSEISSAQNPSLGACAINESNNGSLPAELPDLLEQIQATFPGAKVREAANNGPL